MPFTSLPILNWSNPDLKFVDLTGDGHADILISEDAAFCWHTSLAESALRLFSGFFRHSTRRKTKLIFANGTQRFFLLICPATVLRTWCTSAMAKCALAQPGIR